MGVKSVTCVRLLDFGIRNIMVRLSLRNQNGLKLKWTGIEIGMGWNQNMNENQNIMFI